MSLLLIAAGAVLVVVALGDAVLTTMTAGNGAGPLAGWVNRWIWRAARAGLGHGSSRLLPYVGALVLLASFATWVLLDWAGWCLLFLGSNSLHEASSGRPASTLEVVYYAGFTVFTLGTGDVVSHSGPWQVVTALASLLGLFLATLSITYLLNVVSAGVSRRKVAASISVLGRTGPEIVLTHWTGERFSSQLAGRLQSLTLDLLQTTQQHLAYPVLHCFHSRDAGTAAPLTLAALDDALVLLSRGVDPSVAPGSDVLVPLRRAMERYAGTVGGSGSNRSAGHPALPPLRQLREVGVPVRPEPEYVAAARADDDRRRALHQLVQTDAWSWPLRDTGGQPDEPRDGGRGAGPGHHPGEPRNEGKTTSLRTVGRVSDG